MAKKRTHKRKPRKGLSAAPRRRHHKRRRRTMSSKGMLADLMNPTIAIDSAKKSLAAFGGGIMASITNKSILPATASHGTKTLAALAVGFLASSFGMPALGAGFAGGLGAITFQNGLNEAETNYAENNSLSADTPVYLDEDDRPMVMEERDGAAQYRYLSEDEIKQLDEAGAFTDYEIVN